MVDKKTVLLTGAAGRIGTILRTGLADAYHIKGIDRIPAQGLDSVVADLTDMDSITPAFKGVDVVVHLAADPRHTPDIWWDTLMPDNVVASANVFEAAKQGGAKKVVFFSSMHVNGMYELDHPYSAIAAGDYAGLDPERIAPVTHEMPDRPDGPYAVSKIFGESLGRYYSEEYGISVICLRLGTVGPDDRPADDPRSYVSWLSHRDLVQLVEKCIETEDIGYDVFFAASGNSWRIYDTVRARQVLGYAPQDNAESFR
jgi:nucleoside-diphosphate-sugar epimerase